MDRETFLKDKGWANKDWTMYRGKVAAVGRGVPTVGWEQMGWQSLLRFLGEKRWFYTREARQESLRLLRELGPLGAAKTVLRYLTKEERTRVPFARLARRLVADPSATVDGAQWWLQHYLWGTANILGVLFPDRFERMDLVRLTLELETVNRHADRPRGKYPEELARLAARLLTDVPCETNPIRDEMYEVVWAFMTGAARRVVWYVTGGHERPLGDERYALEVVAYGPDRWLGGFTEGMEFTSQASAA